MPRDARAESMTLSLGVFSAMGPDEGVWKAPPGKVLLISFSSPEEFTGCFKIRVPLAEARNTCV